MPALLTRKSRTPNRPTAKLTTALGNVGLTMGSFGAAGANVGERQVHRPDIRKDQLRAFCGEPAGRRPSDPRSGTGNDAYFSLQPRAVHVLQTSIARHQPRPLPFSTGLPVFRGSMVNERRLSLR
jgi:hypothetical protein